MRRVSVKARAGAGAVAVAAGMLMGFATPAMATTSQGFAPADVAAETPPPDRIVVCNMSSHGFAFVVVSKTDGSDDHAFGNLEPADMPADGPLNCDSFDLNSADATKVEAGGPPAFFNLEADFNPDPTNPRSSAIKVGGIEFVRPGGFGLRVDIADGPGKSAVATLTGSDGKVTQLQ